MTRAAAAALTALVVGTAGLPARRAHAQDTATPVDRGRVIFERWCVHCHGDGPGYPGTAALAVKYRGTATPALLEARRDPSLSSIVKSAVRHGAPMMPFFRQTEIDDRELDALAAYLTQAHRTRDAAALEQRRRGVDELERRVTGDPADYVNRTALAAVYLKDGRVEEAMAHLEAAIRTEPAFATARYNLGTAMVMQGRLREAIAQLEEAVRLAPAHSEARNNLGHALQLEGRLAEAIPHFRQAVQASPANGAAHLNLANALDASGETEEAIRHFQQAIALNPGVAEAHNNLGVALGSLGRLDEAAAHFRRALELRPDYGDARKNLDMVLDLQKAPAPRR